MRFNRLTVSGDHTDVYDVPDSPPDKRARNEPRRPWGWSRNMDTGNTIHVSTPNGRAGMSYQEEPLLPSKQYTTPREKPTMTTHIHEALKTKPNEGLTIDGILDWFCTYQPTLYQERGKASLRKTIQTNLNRKQNGKNCTVAMCTDGTWRLRLDKTVVAEPIAKESTQTHTEGQTHTPSVLSLSTGGRTPDGTPALCKDMPRSELLQTAEPNRENGQVVQPTAFSQAESECGPTSIDSQPKAPAQETGAKAGNDTPQPRAATRRAWTSDERSPNHDETPTQQSGPSAEISSTIHNDNPSGVGEDRVPVDLCYGPEQAKSTNIPTPAKRLKKVQDNLKPLVRDHIPFQAPGITTEEIYQHVMASSAQATDESSSKTLKVHVRAILKYMFDSGEARREAAKGDNGGSTFVYTLSPSFQTEPVPPVYMPPIQSSLTTWTHAHQDTAQSVSGHPANLDHLLLRPEEGLSSTTPAAGTHESLGNDDGAHDISQPGASDQSLAEPEPAIRASDRSGYELPQAQNGSGIGGEDSDKADKELLETARRLRTETELATNDLSISEFQMQQAQSKCLTLERQASEQRSKEVELLTHAQRLREELMQAEREAAECQKGADMLEKEADDERKSCKEYETIIAATKERATKIEEKRQKIRDELKV